jgi:hypothetical protein
LQRYALALGGAAELFAYNAAKRFFQRLLSILNMLAEDFVEQGLVVSAARLLDLVAEPGEDLVIDSDGDAGFPSADRNHRAALRITEIVFTFHGLPHRSSQAKYMHICAYMSILADYEVAENANVND